MDGPLCPPWPVYRFGVLRLSAKLLILQVDMPTEHEWMQVWLLACLERLLFKLKPPELRVLDLGLGFIRSNVLYAVVELGIPDALAAGPVSLTQLGAVTCTAPAKLSRLMRAASELGVFSVQQHGAAEPRYRHNTSSEVLKSTHPSSVSSMVRQTQHLQCMHSQLQSVTTSMSADPHLAQACSARHSQPPSGHQRGQRQL